MEQDKTLELLEEMKKINQMTLMHQRVMSVLMLVFVVAVVSLLPTVVETLNTAKTTLTHMNEAITQMEGALSEVETLATEAGNAMDGMEKALENINGIDIETLNQAITDLGEVVQPMADFFGRFR